MSENLTGTEMLCLHAETGRFCSIFVKNGRKDKERGIIYDEAQNGWNSKIL